MKHKLLSILLSLVMVFSLLPTMALADADGGEGDKDSTTTEATSIDLDTFIKWVVTNNYTVDGKDYKDASGSSAAVVDGKLVVKWSPQSGCFQLEANENDTTTDSGNHGLDDDCPGTPATGNTPNRANSDGYAQYQPFKDVETNVTIKNVHFIYEPVAFKMCANSQWKGEVSETIPAELQFENKGNTTLIGCTFDKAALSLWNDGGEVVQIVKDCTFSNVDKKSFNYTKYGDYAIHYLKGGKIYVSGNTFTNVTRGMMVYAPNNTETYIVNNDFSGVADDEAMLKVDNTNTATKLVVFGNNDTSDRGTVCRMKNEIAIHTGENNSINYTGSDTKTALDTADIASVNVAENGVVTSEYSYVAQIGENKYTTLADAVSHAQNNDTITLLKDAAIQNDTVSESGAGILTIAGKNLTIDGRNHTITAVRGASATGNVSAINVTNSADVTFKNLTIQGENITRHGINVYGGTVKLNNVTLKNFGGYGLEIQGTATATDLIATSNTWGGVNVDIKSLPTGNSSFVLNSGEVASVIVEHTENDTKQTSTAEIKGGKVGAALIIDSSKPVVTLAGAYLKISGGYFANDPSDYCVEGLTGVASDDATYPWTVGERSETKAEVATGEPAVNSPKVSYSDGSDEKTLLEATQDALKESDTTVTGSGIETAAATVANKNTVTTTDNVLKQLNTAMGTGTANAENTNIVIQTYMDITITGVNAAKENQSFSVDIQPMYRTVATIADVNNDVKIVLSGAQGSSVNAVQIGESQKLNVQAGYPVEVMIPLPSDFANENDTLYVQHRNHEYTATVKESGITFINPHGFSVFTVSKESQTVAKVGDNNYTSFQAAVDAVANDGTVEVVGGNTDYTATISGSSKTFKVKNTLDSEITVSVNNDSKTIARDDEQSFTYTKPSGSSGSNGPTAYPVTVESATNGSVTTSLKSASKGDTVTLTVKADAGYLLKSLVVSDNDEAKMKLTDKGDGIYSFTMPGGKVTVSAVFAKNYGYERGYASCPKDATCPIEPYADAVSAAWYHDGVHFCIENGLMTGVSRTSFLPDGDVTRAQVVTILWRLEGKPVVNYAMQFEDATAGEWFTEAVRWAASNGIVTGYSDKEFGPNDAITREQFVAILYRYSQFKGYDVSVGEDTNILDFDDAASISTYAVPAIQWACGSGMISGVSALTLDPQGVTSRAQAATMFMRYCENVNE